MMIAITISSHIHLGQRGTLDIFGCFEFFGESIALFGGSRLLLVLGQFLQRRSVVPQIDLGADQQKRRLLAVMRNFRHPLRLFDKSKERESKR